jgi:hypothetical protein
VTGVLAPANPEIPDNMAMTNKGTSAIRMSDTPRHR